MRMLEEFETMISGTPVSDTLCGIHSIRARLGVAQGISDGAYQGSVVMVTGRGDEEVAVQAMKAEAWYYSVKRMTMPSV